MRSALSTVLGLCTLVSARCGTKTHENIGAMHLAYQAYEAAMVGQPNRRQQNNYKINVYFHVITENNTVAGGHISQATLDEQMQVLNDKYQGTGFTFNNVNTSYKNEPAWRKIDAGSDTEYKMKSRLRKGKYSDLNIYVDSIAPDVRGEQALGYATLPDKASKRGFAFDGIVIDGNTFPGVIEPPYNLGITLVHEVGHWLSLLHTFERGQYDPNGCSSNGDFILDTPAEASAAFGCDTGRDTCKGIVQDENKTSQPGVDPIHNYMDYSDDSCLNTFSNGQIKRMQTSFKHSRLNYKQGNEGEHIDPEPGHEPN